MRARRLWRARGEEDVRPPSQFEGPLWQLVTTQPLHMLSSDLPELAGVPARAGGCDDRATCATHCAELAHCTWGARNLVRIRHPLSGALPGLAGLLDMPTLQLPGDHDMPRVQDGAFGASERFAVSPGHEDRGLPRRCPAARAAIPLSPYYRAGFHAWARGEALPFLPGPRRTRSR